MIVMVNKRSSDQDWNHRTCAGPDRDFQGQWNHLAHCKLPYLVDFFIQYILTLWNNKQ